MKKLTNYLYYISMIAIALWVAYTKGWILADFEIIKPKVAIEMINKDKNITLLDVRTTQEYNQAHLPNALHIPLDNLANNLNKLPKDKKILIYCRSGNRSIEASRILKKHGYTPIDIKGGLIALASNGMKVVAAKGTKK
jgi:rhodanese-related sulfurtransferase